MFCKKSSSAFKIDGATTTPTIPGLGSLGGQRRDGRQSPRASVWMVDGYCPSTPAEGDPATSAANLRITSLKLSPALRSRFNASSVA
jgi:hypothetical protein